MVIRLSPRRKNTRLHKKNLRKASAKLDRLKKTDPVKYRRKEISLNKKLRALNLI